MRQFRIFTFTKIKKVLISVKIRIFRILARGGTLPSFFITFKVMGYFRPGNVTVRDAALI